MFSRLSNIIKPMMLNVQYRSHPFIMNFSSRMFYDGALMNGVVETERKPPRGFAWPVDRIHGVRPVAFVNSLHRENVSDGGSKSNPAEADIVLKIVSKFINGGGLSPKDIGIISPYAGQNRILRSLMAKNPNFRGIELNSVDAFQVCFGCCNDRVERKKL